MHPWSCECLGKGPIEALWRYAMSRASNAGALYEFESHGKQHTGAGYLPVWFEPIRDLHLGIHAIQFVYHSQPLFGYLDAVRFVGSQGLGWFQSPGGCPANAIVFDPDTQALLIQPAGNL